MLSRPIRPSPADRTRSTSSRVHRRRVNAFQRVPRESHPATIVAVHSPAAGARARRLPGNYPDLVRQNAIKNKATCLEAGLRNFLIEVVTDKPIGPPKDPRIRQVQVPTSYRPKREAMFKARALRYCLEDEVNELADEDYILHLDEETIMTYDSVCRIIDFIREGKYDFGQGLITYANEPVVNWITTLADSARVADDVGKLGAQFCLFHKPIFHWKRSYILAKVNDNYENNNYLSRYLRTKSQIPSFQSG